MATESRMHRDPLYGVYHSMKQRCNNPNSQVWRWYGLKGIRVNFESFDSFRTWARTNGYETGLSIDRINSDDNYSPENCRWIPGAENTRIARSRETGKTKLSMDIASEICEAYSTGLFTYKELAQAVNVRDCSISKIVTKARNEGADIPTFKQNGPLRVQI